MYRRVKISSIVFYFTFISFVLYVCIATDDAVDSIIARAEFPTTTPEETLGLVRKWLKEEADFIHAVGIGMLS